VPTRTDGNVNGGGQTDRACRRRRHWRRDRHLPIDISSFAKPTPSRRIFVRARRRCPGMTMAWLLARKTVRHHLGEKVSRVVCEQDFPEARRVQRQPAPRWRPPQTTSSDTGRYVVDFRSAVLSASCFSDSRGPPVEKRLENRQHLAGYGPTTQSVVSSNDRSDRQTRAAKLPFFSTMISSMSAQARWRWIRRD
jgi:hypothetical protein